MRSCAHAMERAATFTAAAPVNRRRGFVVAHSYSPRREPFGLDDFMRDIQAACSNEPGQVRQVVGAGNSNPWIASTALIDFSTAWWTRKPTTSSSWWESLASKRAASRSDAPLRSSSSATSISSGVGKHAALAQRALNHRAANRSPTASTIPIDDHDIDRNTEIPQLAPQANRLRSDILDVGLDHENVVVGVVPDLLTRVRAKQHDPRVRGCDTRQTRSNLIDHVRRSHVQTVADALTEPAIRGRRQVLAARGLGRPEEPRRDNTVTTSTPSNASNPSPSSRNLDKIAHRRRVYTPCFWLRALWADWPVDVRAVSGPLGSQLSRRLPARLA